MSTIYQNRFEFIDDEILRDNIAITFRYIHFLTSVSNEKNGLDGQDISYSIFKDMIINTGSIIESCLHYCLKKYFETNKVKSSSVMPYEWKHDKCVQIYEITPNESEVCAVIRHKKPERLTEITQFQTINIACKNAGILDEGLFKKVEFIRQKRNNIHLTALTKTDDLYTGEDTKIVFSYAKDILINIKEKLSFQG